MSHSTDSISSSPAFATIVRSTIVAVTAAMFVGALITAIMGQREIAVILALAAPLGLSALGFAHGGHNEAALGMLGCVLIIVVTLILFLSPLGVHSLATAAYIGIVIMGGLLLSRRAYVAIVGLTVFAATAAFVHDLGGYSRSVVTGHSGWHQYAYFLLILAPAAFLGRVIAEKLFGSLGEAEHAARTDPVTALMNRSAFFAAASKRLEVAHAKGEGAVLVVADLDAFRRTNLVVGYQAADNILRECARRLQAESSGDLVARIGDDEFAVLRVGIHEGLAAEFARVVQETLAFEHLGAAVAAATGYTRFPRDGTDIEALMIGVRPLGPLSDDRGQTT